MLAYERQGQILREAELRGVVRVTDLVRDLRVSDVTIRRDLEALVQQGLVEKVHGGARIRPHLLDRSGPIGGRATRPAAVPTEDTEAPTAPNLASTTGAHIGVLVPSGADYFRRIVDGIHLAVTAAGATLTMSLSQYQHDREAGLVNGLLDSGVDGVLLVPTLDQDGDCRWLDDLALPTVLIEREIRRFRLGGVSSVRTAHERGAAQAVHALYRLGHERIALVTRGDSQVADLVREGWLAAMTELNLPDDVPVVSGKDVGSWPRWEPVDVGRIVDQLRAGGVTGLVCHNDENALAIMDHARSVGWSVPDGLSVIAYEDEIAQLASPALTAVSPPKEEVGRVAAAMLLDLIRTPDQAARHLTIEPRLVVRASTGPAASPVAVAAGRAVPPGTAGDR